MSHKKELLWGLWVLGVGFILGFRERESDQVQPEALKCL